MELILQQELFKNDKYSLTFGDDKEAIFTIVDEEFPGNNQFGRINCITILIRDYKNRTED